MYTHIIMYTRMIHIHIKICMHSESHDKEWDRDNPQRMGRRQPVHGDELEPKP